MLAKPLLVPSNDALRVLRQLAFAGSTIATVAVVTLNYNIHHRIRLAEQCLETKKQIRALSNGNREAHMARVIEAAENGQDFTIQAMREQRSRVRRFKPSLLTSSGSQSSGAHESGNSPMPQGGESSHHKRERTAQKIRRATVTMTSTAPTHVYGRPMRYRKPTRSWPDVESEKAKALDTQAPPAGKDRLYTKREDVAEKIKRATMAMTSTAPVHVYGRPPKAVSKTLPNLHDSVASWLSTAPEDDNSTDAAPGLTEPLLASTPSDTNLEQVEKTTLLGPPNTDHGLEEAAERLGSLDGGIEPKIVDEPPAGKSQTSPNVQDHQVQLESGNSSTGVLQSMFQTSWTMGTLEKESNISNAASTIDEKSSADSEKHSSLPFATNNSPHYLESNELVTCFESSPAAQALSHVETLSGGLQCFDEAKNNENSPVMDSAITEGGFVNSRPLSEKPSFPRQPDHDIQPEQPPKINTTHPPDLMSWPHFQSLDGSNETMEEVPRVDQQVVGLGMGDTLSEQDQIRYEWTPFPHIPQAPETITSLPELKRDVVSHEGAKAESKEAAVEPHEVSQMWTPFPRSHQGPERRTGLPNLEQDDMSVYQDRWPESNLSEDLVDGLTEGVATIPNLTGTGKVRLALVIHEVFSWQGMMDGQKAWQAAVNSRLQHNDFATVDFLYAEFVEQGMMSISPRRPIVHSLLQWHFERSKYSERAAEILFPDRCSDSTDLAESDSCHPRMFLSISKENRRDSLFAIYFLRSLWEIKADSDWLLLNFRRVIVAAKLRGVKLVEGIFAVVIRYLASVGDMPTAQAVYDEMVFYHQLKATFHSRTLLIRGYARICDWYRVEREIESLHGQGLSRTRPHGYALMINAVLQEYAARASIEQFQDLLIKSISYWGLVPTSAISVTTIQAYLSHQRYDLIREWMETLQVLFPQIEAETSSFQWSLGYSWLRTGATCEVIEKTIKAVAYRNPHTRLRSFSLPMVHEALSRDLAAKLDTAKAKTEPCKQGSMFSSAEGNDFISTKPLDDYLTAAFSLTASTVSQNLQPSPEVIELHRQATAVQRLSTFLTSTPSSEEADQFSFPDPGSGTTTEFDTPKSPVPTTTSLSHLQDSIPRILTAEFLPGTAVIITAVLRFYHARAMERLTTDHALLLWVCDKLLHADRAFSATDVIQEVYGDAIVRRLAGLDEWGSRGAVDVELPGQGAIGFGIQFYEFWMRLVWVTRSLLQFKRVTAEVLRLSRPGREFSYRMDDGTEKSVLTGLRITSSFLFLTRSIASRGLKKDSSMWRHEDEDVPVREVIWLIKELEKRREQQIGRMEAGMWMRTKWRHFQKGWNE
ncbi:hypothetical protein EPUS_03972 [Endocarpon pusillum Z07020]|uniref:Uncharacterized protein n=1 Tax=Endocarpon pusillum (strain Z07020 / HMAS-L-300199) TaxID=1263415 RepID=U1GB70_ENDPU|nr:uncharacterized protein EPUS_03972 [Endocarpon pusillum Z07020]ERF69268.1 hypothetical protein EPUS_03972 [Endocarpon pusillum Z07020]